MHPSRVLLTPRDICSLPLPATFHPEIILGLASCCMILIKFPFEFVISGVPVDRVPPSMR